MNRVIKIIKNNILGFIIGAILFGGIGIAVAVQSNIASSDIAYTNVKNANVTSVKQAVDDLYGKLGNSYSKKEMEDFFAKYQYENVYATFKMVTTCIDSDYLICKVINQYKGNTAAIADGYGVFYHNGTITGATAGIDATTDILDADDYSFRYAGASDDVNNYVCFGYPSTFNEDDCKDTTKNSEYLYRIIGIFTFDNGSTYHIKLIKNKVYSTAVWDSSVSNTWNTASLRTTLNGAYLTGLEDWDDLIYQPTWYVGGFPNINTKLKTIYNEEMASTGGSTPPTTGLDETTNKYIDNTGKIGLIYVSDYGYAASPSYWKTNVTNYNNTAKDYDWMFISDATQWTISRASGNYGGIQYAFLAGNEGSAPVQYIRSVRPAIYLTSNARYHGGSGTASDPWCIKLS